MNFLVSLRRLPRYIVGIALIISIDIVLGKEISLWVPLLIPIGLATWNHGRDVGMVSAVAGACALLGQDVYFGSLFSAWSYLLISLASKAIVFGAFVFLIGKLRSQEVGRVFIKRPN